MKSIYMIAAALTLQISVATASENSGKDGAPVAEVNAVMLAPVTPSVADFEETVEMGWQASVADLAPLTPAEADFEDHI